MCTRVRACARAGGGGGQPVKGRRPPSMAEVNRQYLKPQLGQVLGVQAYSAEGRQCDPGETGRRS